MSLLNPALPSKENVFDQHPWTGIIEDVYLNKIKHAHNSIHNPKFPKNKENISPNVKRTKFTIIGDRVTKEFIYCVNLVKGLHKYRKKNFDSPVIRGVTTVEWPSVWNDLKVKYGGTGYCLRSSVAVLHNGKFLGGENELKQLVESKYSYHLCLDYHKEGVSELAKFIKGSGRPCAYMNIAINGHHIGTLIFMLYSDVVPITCENFLRLCKATRGGYSGTPVHRIVKEGWIQCGGFGLKNTDMSCENFIVPHDRRGVLCMANDGRDIDCSTQFFVLLLPAPWMASKYVAFGQLIEGKKTLEKIEAVPTWYESPTSEIIIYKAGIFKTDCHDFVINKGTNKYIDGHIEDLNALGDLLYEILLEKVFLTVQLREIERLEKEEGEGADNGVEKDRASCIRETKRFTKEDIKKQHQRSKTDDRLSPRQRTSLGQEPSTASATENSEFDVETYDPEGIEGTNYKHQSIHTPSLVAKPAKPHYIPLTDVPYPGEKDSNFNLKRFLQGEYCLESDLQFAKVEIPHQERFSYSSDLFDIEDSDFESEEDENLDSDDEKEIQRYLMLNSDRVSFAGEVIKKIGKGVGKLNLLSEARKSELITDDQLRRLRLASISREQSRDRKVSINVSYDKEHHKIKRRQTGFVHPEDLEKIRSFRAHVQGDADAGEVLEEEDQDAADFNKYRHVSMSADVPEDAEQHKIKRRQTGFVRPEDLEKIRVFHKDSTDDDSDDGHDDKKVRIHPTTADSHGPVARRPTGFAHPKDLGNSDVEDDDDKKQKVRIHPTTTESHGAVARRPTAFVRPTEDIEDEENDADNTQKVRIHPTITESHGAVARRPTVFVRPTEDIEDEENDGDNTQKVRIHPTTGEPHGAVARRPTAFVRPTEDIEDEENDGDNIQKLRIPPTAGESHGSNILLPTAFLGPTETNQSDDEDDDDNKLRVRMSPMTAETRGPTARRPTAFVRLTDYNDDDYKDDDSKDSDDTTEVRPSVLLRLFEDVKGDEEPPTLKHYKPISESNQKNILLFSSNYRIKSEESTKEKYLRHSQNLDKALDEHVLNLQHGRKPGRKISSDYVKTLDQMEQRLENSLRSLEFAKTRPTLSVFEYQMKNKLYNEKLKLETVMAPTKNFDKHSSEQSLPVLPPSQTYSTFEVPETKSHTDHSQPRHRRSRSHRRQLK